MMYDRCVFDMICVFFFFFSSRRRHTRSDRDWSSDVCSSDLGAFALPGMRLELEGEANDYVAKGLTGGEMVIRPFREAAAVGGTAEHVLLGNTALYGATAGRLFAAGRAGDRFAVRNSGAIAVIEGAGAHCCEYMTAGVVGGLGPGGRKFAAGGSNGVAYVLDDAETFSARCNTDMVAV